MRLYIHGLDVLKTSIFGDIFKDSLSRNISNVTVVGNRYGGANIDAEMMFDNSPEYITYNVASYFISQTPVKEMCSSVNDVEFKGENKSMKIEDYKNSWPAILYLSEAYEKGRCKFYRESGINRIVVNLSSESNYGISEDKDGNKYMVFNVTNSGVFAFVDGIFLRMLAKDFFTGPLELPEDIKIANKIDDINLGVYKSTEYNGRTISYNKCFDNYFLSARRLLNDKIADDIDNRYGIKHMSLDSRVNI